MRSYLGRDILSHLCRLKVKGDYFIARSPGFSQKKRLTAKAASLGIVPLQFKLILDVALVAETPLGFAELGYHIAAIVAVQFIAGRGTAICVFGMRIDGRKFGFKIPPAGIREWRRMGAMAGQAHHV